jgi:hypothetical protein
VTRLDVQSHEEAPLSLKLRFVHDEDSLRLEAIAASSEPTSAHLIATIHKIIGRRARTTRDLRDAVRTEEGATASNAEIDAAVRELERDGLVKNTGTGKKHRWVALSSPKP